MSQKTLGLKMSSVTQGWTWVCKQKSMELSGFQVHFNCTFESELNGDFLRSPF